MASHFTSVSILFLFTALASIAFAVENEPPKSPERQLSVSQQLCGPYQLLSEYSFGAAGECPDKLKMDVKLNRSRTMQTVKVPYERIKIDLGSWYSAREGRSDNNFTGVHCVGPSVNTTLSLHSGHAVLRDDFERTYNHSASTMMLLKSLAPRVSSGVFWFSRPRVAAFNCSKHDGWFGEPWFRSQFTFIFFNDVETVPISFIGKVRMDGTSRVVSLNMTGGIRYFIAAAPQSTCIYRSVDDGAGGKGPVQRKPAGQLPASEPACNWVCKPNPAPIAELTGATADGAAHTDGKMNTTHPNGSTHSNVSAHTDGSAHSKGSAHAEGVSNQINRTKTGGQHAQTQTSKQSHRFTWLWCDAPHYAKSGKRACFPSTAQVMLRSGRHVRMDALRIGDEVLASEGMYSRVIMFTHAISDASQRPFVALSTAHGRTLTLSPGHLLALHRKSARQLIRADAVRIGDELTDARGYADIVTKINMVRAQGLYNPHTSAGNIVVDGVLVSCYTAEIEPAVAHSALAPIRSLFAAVRITAPQSMCADGCPRLLSVWRLFVRSVPASA